MPAITITTSARASARRPSSIADFLALTGDSVDNIPGVPGIGKKTAAELFAHFGSLDELYANLERVATLKLRGAATLAAKLLAHKEAAYLARRLTGIVCDMPLARRRRGLEARAARRRRSACFFRCSRVRQHPAAAGAAYPERQPR